MAYAAELTLDELRERFRPFCEKYGIRRLEVFGSAARNELQPDSDVDLLVTLDESRDTPIKEFLRMAGEAEDVAGRRVDFVFRHSLEKSKNKYAREHILATAVSIYGDLSDGTDCGRR